MNDEHNIPPQIPVTEEMLIEIRGAMAEIDPAQMAIVSRLTPAQRAAQAFNTSEYVLSIAISRLRQANPELSEIDAKKIALEGYYQRNPTTYLPQRP